MRVIMKKLLQASLLTFALCGVLFVTQASAQFGLRAGVNFANFNDVDGLDLNSNTGFMVGLYYDFEVPASPVSVQPEVLYTQKGTEQGGTKINLDYIEVPVLVKFSFAPGPVTPSVYLGPYAGFVMNSEASDGSVSVEIDNAQTDFGGVVGGEIDINAGTSNINLGLRYGFGLNEAFEDGQGKNGVFSIVGGISF